MQKLSRVGYDTGRLADEELRAITTEVVEAVWPALHAREIFEVTELPNAGIRSYRHYVRTDMGPALITMDGETLSLDRTQKVPKDTAVPVTGKDFVLNWRDILAARYNNVPLDLSEGANAARQIAEEENRMLFSGETLGSDPPFPCYGILGLSTGADEENAVDGGDWPDDAIVNINEAVGNLESQGHTSGPYVLIGRVAQIRTLNDQLPDQTMTYKKFLTENDIVQDVIADDSLYAALGTEDSALVVEVGKANFDLLVGQDVTVWSTQIDNMNMLFRVFEVVSPRIKRPTAISEIQTIAIV